MSLTSMGLNYMLEILYINFFEVQKKKATDVEMKRNVTLLYLLQLEQKSPDEGETRRLQILSAPSAGYKKCKVIKTPDELRGFKTFIL